MLLQLVFISMKILENKKKIIIIIIIWKKKIQKSKIQKNDDNSEDEIGSSKVFTQTKTRLNDTYKDPLIPNTIDSNQNSIEIGVDCENKI